MSMATIASIRSISSASLSTNNATRDMNGGTAAAISAACASVTRRLLCVANIRPMASTPASAAAVASAAEVTPQTLTRTRLVGVLSNVSVSDIVTYPEYGNYQPRSSSGGGGSQRAS